MKFKQLNVPDSWKHYWSRYPEGYTILEALISWVSQVDDMVDNVNSWNDYLDNFVATFDKELQQIVTDTLSDWQESGFLDVVISEALQWQLTDYIATNEADKLSINEQLQDNTLLLLDNAISPEQFEGTDTEKVQQALDHALENKLVVKFARMYDITGSTLKINRPNLYYATERRQLYLLGVGGGITKHDSGFMFDADYNNTGDVSPIGLRYFSTSGAGTTVWNGDKIIRIKSTNCEYRNVDTVITALTRYTQTVYFKNEHITGGKGWKFRARRYLDTLIDGCLVEDCEHFISNTSIIAEAANNSLRIINSLIENLTGKVAELGGSYSTAIKDNYIEYCNAYFDLDTLATNYSHYGLSISGNAFHFTPQQKTDRVPAFKIGTVNQSLEYGNGGFLSTNNVAAGGVLYDLTNMKDREYVTGIGDFGSIVNSNRYISLGKPQHSYLADNFTKIMFGITATYTKQFYITLVPPNSDTTLEITTPFDLKKFMTVDVLFSSPTFTLKNVIVDDTTDKIVIVLTNTHATTALNVNPRVVITDPFIFDD